MKIKRFIAAASVAALAATGVVVSALPAGADLGGAVLVTCTDASTGTVIGSAKLSPGITSFNQKNTISSTLNVGGCVTDEAALDEIAEGSKFGVTKTQAAGRPATTGGEVKAKFTSYGDCLGIVVPDPDVSGEYPATAGTVQVKWDSKLKTDVFAVLNTSIAASINGLVTKGMGVGGEFSSSVGFSPAAADNNGFVNCALGIDPAAVGKYLDVVTPSSLSITLPDPTP